MLNGYPRPVVDHSVILGQFRDLHQDVEVADLVISGGNAVFSQNTIL